MDAVGERGAVLHLVRGGPRPAELSPPPDGHTVVELPPADARPEEWDRILGAILAHAVVVTW